MISHAASFNETWRAGKENLVALASQAAALVTGSTEFKHLSCLVDT